MPVVVVAVEEEAEVEEVEQANEVPLVSQRNYGTSVVVVAAPEVLLLQC